MLSVEDGALSDESIVRASNSKKWLSRPSGPPSRVEWGCPMVPPVGRAERRCQAGPGPEAVAAVRSALRPASDRISAAQSADEVDIVIRRHRRRTGRFLPLSLQTGCGRQPAAASRRRSKCSAFRSAQRSDSQNLVVVDESLMDAVQFLHSATVSLGLGGGRTALAPSVDGISRRPVLTGGERNGRVSPNRSNLAGPGGLIAGVGVAGRRAERRQVPLVDTRRCSIEGASPSGRRSPGKKVSRSQDTSR